MKTTIEIPDPLLSDAKKLAAREGTTLRALVEQGLRHAITERRARRKKPYKQRLIVFRGDGLTPEFQNANFAEILEAADAEDEK
jgi:hypothetical protein